MSGNSGAEITLHFGTADEVIRASPFAKALEHFMVVLRELDSTVSRTSRGSLSWVITDLSMESPAKISVAGIPTGKTHLDLGGQVARAFINGAAHLETKKTHPDFFNERALKAIGGLARSQARISGTIRVRAASRSVDLSEHITANVKWLLRRSHSALGSVEGQLEAVDVHGKLVCRVYESRTGIGIPCKFSDDMFEEVRKALGKRVLVYGTKKTDWQGQPLELKAEKIRLLRKNEDLPKHLPVIKDFTGGKRSEDHIRELWNG